MKKLLLATAAFALIAPAAQAEIKLDLGGFFKGYAGFASQDTANNRDFDIKRKSQIFFQGETTLDNGLTVGYNGQLMADNNVDPAAPSDQNLEQSYLYFSGNWGRVNLGRENGAAYLLQVTAPASDANLDGSDIEFSFFNQGGANIRQDYAATGAQTLAGARGEDFQYADKITYLTPKFNGFQAGVSYTPEVSTRNQNNYFGQSTNNDLGDYEQLLEAAARYDGEFSGVGVHLGAGYTQADAEAVGPVNSDFNEWNAGAKLTYEAWGFGAAYTEREGNIVASNVAVGDVDTWVVGADYTYGAYTFGATYLNSQGDNGAGEDEYDRYAVGSSYTFGPGMKFNGSVAYHELDAVLPAGNNEAWVFAVGTDIQF